MADTTPYLFIMQGLPGAGKSFYVKGALGMHPGAVVVSADRFPGLYVHDEAGRPVIVPHLMRPAHGACFREAVRAVLAGQTVIVDNTNTTLAEVAPYVTLAMAYGHAPVIVRVTADPAVCAARNTHGVPREAMDRLTQHLSQFVAPSHWKDIPGYAVREVPGLG